MACKIRPRRFFSHVIHVDASLNVFQDDEQHQKGPCLDEVDTHGPQAPLADNGVNEEASVTELNLIEHDTMNNGVQLADTIR